MAASLACVAVLGPVYADTSTTTAAAATKTSASYVVGVAKFETSSLESQKRIILSSFPRLIVADLSTLPFHVDTAAYAVEKSGRDAAVKKLETGKDLAALLDALATRKLEPGIDPNHRSANVVDAIAKIEKAKKTATAPAASAQAMAAKPGLSDHGGLSSVLCTDNKAGQLIEPKGRDYAAAAKASGANLVIHGSIEPVGEYVAITLAGYDANLGRDLFTFVDYASPVDPEPLAHAFAERILEAVAGIPFATIDLSVDPPSAVVMVNGKTLDSDERRIYCFKPGRYDFYASAPDRKTFSTSMDINLGESRELAIALPKESAGIATIKTIPPGLPVYVDGLMVGNSPVEAALTGSRAVVSTKEKDEKAVSAILPASGTVEILLDTDAARERAKKSLDTERSHFYGSLGLLLASAIPTSLLYGAYSTYYDAASEALTTRLISAYNTSGIALGAFAVLSSGLAINVIVHLVEYVGAAR